MHPRLKPLARSSGGFAMLAVDQREALRAMIEEKTGGIAPDSALREFKTTATQVLSPHASGVLVDPQFGWQAVVDSHAAAQTCPLIAAVDQFIPGETEFVAEAVIDRTLNFERLVQQGALAFKLLVIWRPDGHPEARRSMVEEFVELCDKYDVASIIEPVARPALSGVNTDINAGILEAAAELGALGAHLYKAQVPTLGEGSDEDIFRACSQLTDSIDGPWVVLSSGVAADRFPETVRIACEAGGSGFLAGRAVWASAVGANDLENHLTTASIPRLQLLTATVDEAMART